MAICVRVLSALGVRVRMDEHNNVHMHIPVLRTFVVTICWILLTTLPQSHCEPPPPAAFDYSVCKKQSYKCGNLSVNSYPFWGQNRPRECGGDGPFQLSCQHDDNTTSIQIRSQNFRVEEINSTTRTMRVVPTDRVDDVCSQQFFDTYGNSNPPLFQYSASVYNITVFFDGCTPIPDFPSGRNYTCGYALHYFEEGYEEQELLDEFPALKSCKQHAHVPTVATLAGDGADALKEAIDKGFEVKYDIPQDCTSCGGNDGRCWSDAHVVSCYYCPAESDALRCPHKSKLNLSRKIIVGVASAVMGVFMICIIICCSKCMSSTGQVKFWLTNDQDIEVFLKSHGPLALRRYKFSEVKKMTNSFKVKLGEGGFGVVYKGEIHSGYPVAVKILNASKRNSEDFINEVASISRTSHVNVVTLLGFCLEGRKKALIYEFMANGSLDKFIYNKGLNTTQSLSWDKLWQIAIGIARGLEYLHRGCNTRILHFDIKPHNILLDENFFPKISDFGLAKLCPRKESIISMSDARGTLGYVAPEVWNRNFGGISHKSDVYSYGMMLLEMVGGRKNINAEASHTSEIYFPHWVYNRLEQGGDLRPEGVIIATEENEIVKRMTVVGLWCVQTFPKDRPSMSRVIDMLEGNMNSLKIPPKPVLSSPTRSVSKSPTR